MINASPDTLALLANRRSVPLKRLVEPGPSADQVDEILALAARVPDHRALAPFRFVVFEGEARAAFGTVLRKATRARKEEVKEKKLEASEDLFTRSPVVIAVIASPDEDHKTPVWEQQLTVGAACQNLVVAASALGFGVQWLTEWPAYDDVVADGLGLSRSEKVAGFFYLGTAEEVPKDRKRPDMAKIVTRWSA